MIRNRYKGFINFHTWKIYKELKDKNLEDKMHNMYNIVKYIHDNYSSKELEKLLISVHFIQILFKLRGL